MKQKIVLLFLALIVVLTISSTDSKKLMTLQGNRMTMDWRILAFAQESKRKEIEAVVASTFDEIDAIYNKWNPLSEVSRINQSRAKEPIAISHQMEQFLQRVGEMVQKTEGRFDPTIEPLQKLWKEHLSKGSQPPQEEIRATLAAVGWKRIHIQNGLLVKEDDRTSLDFGGIAKGFCVDLLVERLIAQGVGQVLVEWGGELRAHGEHPEGRGWNVAISGLDAKDEIEQIGQIQLHNQAVATSGDYIDYWTIEEDGNLATYFHILNPITGKPLQSKDWTVASATVRAPTCFEADALAKGAIVHPNIDEARAWTEAIAENDEKVQFWLFSRHFSHNSIAQNNRASYAGSNNTP